ncbi:MAG: AMP-binding protein [Alphaproteobacteria bacterium]|nr:AMP-binding protein [Alphaproteobacteria bacterium]
MNLGQALKCSVARQPGAEAVVDGDVRRDYSQWYDDIRRVAGGLAARGLGAGDHFAVVMRNRYEMAALAWASYMLGAIYTPLSWRGTAEEIGYCLRDAGAKFVAFDGAAEAAVLDACAAEGIPAERTIGAVDAKADVARFETLCDVQAIEGPAAVDSEATCIMLYTSGTTGRPKGVPRSHRAELAAAMNHIAANQYPHGLSQLCVMPLFHTMGQRVMLTAAMLNGKLVLMPAYSAAGALDLIESERIGSIFLVPTMFHDMLAQPDIGKRDLSCVVRAGFAGMPMAPSLVEKCVAHFANAPFTNFYGSSEVYSFTSCLHQNLKPGCAGRANLNQEIRIVAADPDRRVGGDEVVAQGETGEIIASMDALDAFDGYWKRPDADEKAIRDGWYFTGDLGAFDEDGELYVLGRVDDMIISGGENIHPEEVEDALLRSGLAAGVVVIGLPDERMGQRVVAFVEPDKAGITAEDLDAACRQGALADFKRPRGYAFVAAIPRSASGKLLRRKLRDGDYTLLPEFKSTI